LRINLVAIVLSQGICKVIQAQKAASSTSRIVVSHDNLELLFFPRQKARRQPIAKNRTPPCGDINRNDLRKLAGP
jgi:hypothetical protein